DRDGHTVTGAVLPRLGDVEQVESRSHLRDIGVSHGDRRRAAVGAAHRLIGPRRAVRWHHPRVHRWRCDRLCGRDIAGQRNQGQGGGQRRSGSQWRIHVKSPPRAAAAGSRTMNASTSTHSTVNRMNGLNRMAGTKSAAAKPNAANVATATTGHSSPVIASFGPATAYLT